MAAHIVNDGKGLPVPVNHVSDVGLSLHSSCPINRPCFTQNPWNHMDELSETTLKKNTELEWTPPKKIPNKHFQKKGFPESPIPYSNFYKKYHLF